jgi:hypothetical protein
MTGQVIGKDLVLNKLQKTRIPSVVTKTGTERTLVVSKAVLTVHNCSSQKIKRAGGF